MNTPVFSNLLLATEHSDFDAGAEALAFALARHCKLPLAVVLPIVSNPEYEALAPQLAERADALAAAHLRALTAAAANADVLVDPHARHGPEPAREIVDEATERGADLLVIRRRGRRGILAQLLLGQMVREVVVRAPCSVLVAPRAAQMWSHRVLVGCDPASADMTPVSIAAAVAAECGLPLDVVCVGDGVGEGVLERARTTARAFGVDASATRREGRPHEQIVAAAREAGADLIVVGRRNDESLARVWLGGVAQKVIGFAEPPVLVAVGSPRTTGARS